MSLIDMIKARRSIRRYKPDPVPEETLLSVLEAVRWAPSWANTQCSEVVVVRDQGIKSELAKTLRTGNPAARAMTDAPLVVVLCGKRGISGYYNGQPATEKGDWLMFDTGLAMETLCLTAHILGLGTVIVGLFDHKKVAEILKIPESIEVVAMTPLGYRATEGNAPKRKEVSEFVFYDAYGKKDGWGL